MSQAATPLRHPLLRAVDGVEALLDSVAESQPAFLSADEKEELLIGLQTQVCRLEALRARTVAAAGDVAEERGTRSAGAWLAHRTHQDPPVGRRWQRLAEGLDQRWPVVAEAYAAGAASTGRSRRLFSPGQRKAMAVRDRHCRVEGCDVPAAWCEAHHLEPWRPDGGPTSPTASSSARSTTTAPTTTATT